MNQSCSKDNRCYRQWQTFAYNFNHWSHENVYSRIGCVKKAGFSDDVKDDDSDNPFSTLKHSIEQLQSRDETLVPGNIRCNNILLTQEILTDEIIVAEMWADESDIKEEEEKEGKQEADVAYEKTKCITNTWSAKIVI